MRGYEVIIQQSDVPAFDTRLEKKNIFSVILPDKNAPFCFVVSRGAFIKKTTTLTITDGVLQGIHIEKPSEIAGLVKIPLDISQKIADLPKGLLSARVDYVTSENNLLTQQAAVLEGQAKVIKAQQALEALRKSVPGEATPTPTAASQ